MTARAFGCHPLAVVSAVTAQAGGRVGGVWPVSKEALATQIRLLLGTFRVHAVQVGLVADGDQARTLGGILGEIPAPVVVDPVLSATGGGRLFSGPPALLQPILERATVVTPNLEEAARLAGMQVDDLTGMEVAAKRLRELGAEAVLVKGGHLPAGPSVDLLWDGERVTRFEAPRRALEVRGTGCTLSTGLACGLAQGLPLEEAIRRAKDRLLESFAQAYALEDGNRYL